MIIIGHNLNDKIETDMLTTINMTDALRMIYYFLGRDKQAEVMKKNLESLKRILEANSKKHKEDEKGQT